MAINDSRCDIKDRLDAAELVPGHIGKDAIYKNRFRIVLLLILLSLLLLFFYYYYYYYYY